MHTKSEIMSTMFFYLLTDVYFNVERILQKRRRNQKTWEYEIKWEGFEETTWEPERNIPTHLIDEFCN